MDKEQTSKKSGVFNYLLYFFATIGVISTLIFVVLVGLGVYAWQTNFFGLKSMLQAPTSTFSAPKVEDGKLKLNSTQEQLLESAGIDSQKLQQKSVQELQTCAEKQLGKERAQKLESGQISPTYSDLQKLKPCAE